MNVTPTFSTFVPQMEIEYENNPRRDDALQAEALQEMTEKYYRGFSTPVQEQLADGTYNKDGGTFTIQKGRVVSLTAANGESYTDIKYDTRGNILSMKTSAGHTWERREILGPDGILKFDGYSLKLSNLTLRYDFLIVDSRGVTHLSKGNNQNNDTNDNTDETHSDGVSSSPNIPSRKNSGGFVSTLTLSGTKGTMEFRSDGTMGRYTILTKSGNSYVYSPPPLSIPTLHHLSAVVA